MERRHSNPDNPNSDVEEKLRNLHLTWAELEGKTVLDLGAREAFLANAAAEHGIKLLSLDQDQPQIADAPYVVGNALRLPFRDNSIDLIISHGGPPVHMNTFWEINQSMLEIKRALKSGGQFRMLGMLEDSLFDIQDPDDEEIYGDEPGTVGPRFEEARVLRRLSWERSAELLKNYFPNAECHRIEPRSDFPFLLFIGTK